MTSVRGLAEVVLWVHDLPAALAFYRDGLRLPVISPPERTNPIFLRAGEGAAGIPALMVLVQLPPDAPPFAAPRTLHHLALAVEADAFEAERERLQALGLEVRSGQHPILAARTMYVTDPDGNEVELICPA